MTIAQILHLQIDHSKTSKDIDGNFFEKTQRVAYIKGKTNLTHIRGLAGGSDVASTTSGSAQSLNSIHMAEKPWRHQKKEKREKLRKKFSHLDQH